MAIAKNATGTLLKVNNGSFTTVGGVQRVNAPDVKTDLQDVSSHDSTGGFREFLPGMKDGESVTAEMFWVPSNAVHKQLRTDAYAANLKQWQTIFPDLTDNTVAYDGYIVGYPAQANAGEPMKNTLSVKVTGMPVWS